MAADRQVGLLHVELTERILGAFYEVYRELGFGFLESVYEGAMVIALQSLGLRVRPPAEILVWFRGQCVGRYQADLRVEELVVLEIKATRTLEPSHEA